jgi:hypothetical protein
MQRVLDTLCGQGSEAVRDLKVSRGAGIAKYGRDLTGALDAVSLLARELEKDSDSGSEPSPVSHRPPSRGWVGVARNSAQDQDDAAAERPVSEKAELSSGSAIEKDIVLWLNTQHFPSALLVSDIKDLRSGQVLHDLAQVYLDQVSPAAITLAPTHPGPPSARIALVIDMITDVIPEIALDSRIQLPSWLMTKTEARLIADEDLVGLCFSPGGLSFFAPTFSNLLQRLYI